MLTSELLISYLSHPLIDRNSTARSKHAEMAAMVVCAFCKAGNLPKEWYRLQQISGTPTELYHQLSAVAGDDLSPSLCSKKAAAVSPDATLKKVNQLAAGFDEKVLTWKDDISPYLSGRCLLPKE